MRIGPTSTNAICISLAAGRAAGSARPASLTEAVAHRPHGLDHVGMLLAELGAQPANVNVDGARAAVVLVAPDAVEEHLSGEDFAGVLSQKLEQLVLHVREVEMMSADRRLIGRHVELQLAIFDEVWCRRRAGAPQQVADPCLQFGGMERKQAEVVEQLVAQ